MPLDIQSLQSQAGDYLESDDFKSIMPYLLSGGAGAVAGGLATGRRRARDGEDRGSYLARVLRNALVAGGLASGGHYLVNKGLDSTVGSLNDSNSISGHEGQEGPLATATKNIAFSPLTAAGAGATALMATHDNKRIGAGSTDDALYSFAKKTPNSPEPQLLRAGSSADEIANLGGDERLRQRAGLPSSNMTERQRQILRKIPGVKDDAAAKKLKGMLSTATRRGPLSTFGQTPLRRTGRGALGLAAAGVPALLGAILTDKAEPVPEAPAE